MSMRVLQLRRIGGNMFLVTCWLNATTGNVVGELATGDLSGAAQAYGNGASGALNIVGDTAKGQLRNIVG